MVNRFIIGVLEYKKNFFIWRSDNVVLWPMTF